MPKLGMVSSDDSSVGGVEKNPVVYTASLPACGVPFSSEGLSRFSLCLSTWRNAVDEGADRPPVVPVGGEVGDWSVGQFVLNPAEQALLRRLFRQLGAVLVVVPDRHRDGVVQDQRPHQAENQLQLVIDDVRTVCMRQSTAIHSYLIHYCHFQGKTQLVLLLATSGD